MTTAIKINVKPYSDIHGEGVFLTVSLRSNMKPKLWSHAERMVYKHEPFNRLRKLVGVCAGTLAEYQGEKYGDNHNHHDCEIAALEAFDLMISNANQHGRLQEVTVVS